jgi:transcriptional regulator GlxA family with amidase domain
MTQNNSSHIDPKKFGLLIYPGFEALDAFGPIEVVNNISLTHKDITLSIIAATLEPVSTLHKGTHSVGQSVVPTHTFTGAPALDVLIIPGGWGGFNTSPDLQQWVRDTVPELDTLITVCNGSALAAQIGVLDGKSATTNKMLWKQCVAHGPKVNWVAKARWVRDGNIWTSSGVTAGIDATLAWVEDEYGEALAVELANIMEFTRAESPSHDPFSDVFECEDVPAQL